MSKERPQRQSAEGISEQPATVTAALTQVLAGTELVGAPACGACRRSILPGQAVTAYAYRCEHDAQWHVPRVYCSQCDHETIAQPTAGWAEALVTAAIVAVGERVELVPNAVIAWVGPDEGSEPAERSD